MNDQDSRPITHALEALLGGLGPIPGILDQHTVQQNPAPVNHHNLSEKSPLSDNALTDLKSELSQLSQPSQPSKSSKTEKSSSCSIFSSGNTLKESLPVNLENPTVESCDHKLTKRLAEAESTTSATALLNRDDDTDTTILSTSNKIELQKTTSNHLNKEEEKPTIPGLFLCGSNFPSGLAPQLDQKPLPPFQPTPENQTSLLGNDDISMLSIPEATARTDDPPPTDDLSTTEAHPEWEIDLSPIESSSDDSSSDSSSSDESEEGEGSYKLLTPEEQAKILMAGDGGSDDETRDKAKTPGGQLRTKNEIPEVVIPLPDVVITEDMQIIELGVVEQIVNNVVLIKANVSGEYKVLESGSVLCLSDRSVFGVVSETIGRVQAPMYSVMFTNAADIAKAGLSIGLTVFYSEQHAKFVFTKSLKAFKGSDASNINDEEVGEDEIEFSDDEAEAEYKKQIKQKKMGKRDGKLKANCGSNRNGNPSRSTEGCNIMQGISYNDNDDDGPYKTLVRPAGYADHLGKVEAPLEDNFVGEQVRLYPGDQNVGRGRSDRKRGKDSRRPRVGKARKSSGASGMPSKAAHQQGYEMPPNPANYSPSLNRPQNFSLPIGAPSQTPYTSTQAAYNLTQVPEYPSHQSNSQQWAQYFSQMSPYPQYSQFQPSQPMMNNWVNMAPPLPSGAFINPAFFNPQNIAAQPWTQQSQPDQNDSKYGP